MGDTVLQADTDGVVVGDRVNVALEVGHVLALVVDVGELLEVVVEEVLEVVEAECVGQLVPVPHAVAEGQMEAVEDTVVVAQKDAVWELVIEVVGVGLVPLIIRIMFKNVKMDRRNLMATHTRLPEASRLL